MRSRVVRKTGEEEEPTRGFEPRASRLRDGCSGRLSYVGARHQKGRRERLLKWLSQEPNLAGGAYQTPQINRIVHNHAQPNAAPSKKAPLRDAREAGGAGPPSSSLLPEDLAGGGARRGGPIVLVEVPEGRPAK